MRRVWWVVLWCLCAWSAQAWAQAKPPIDSAVEASSAYAAAQLALSSGDWSQAELHLERTLMFAPHHAEARLDLALLLAQRGRTEAAESFVLSLLADARTPPAHRIRLQALMVELSAARRSSTSVAAQAPRWRGQLGLSLSAQQNPLAGTSDSEVTLTLADGDIRLPIDAQDRAAPVVDTALVLSSPQGLRLEAQAQQVMGSIDRFAGRVLLQYNKPLGESGSLVAGVQLQKSHFDEQRRSAFLGRLSSKDRVLLSYFDEPRTGRRALVARADWQGWSPLAVMFVEHEHALRRGPDQTRFGVQDGLEITSKTKAYMSIQAHLDHQGYSPFLSQNAPRRMVTGQLGVEHTLGQYLALRAQITQRWSNIELFSFKDLGATLQVRHQW